MTHVVLGLAEADIGWRGVHGGTPRQAHAAHGVVVTLCQHHAGPVRRHDLVAGHEHRHMVQRGSVVAIHVRVLTRGTRSARRAQAAAKLRDLLAEHYHATAEL